VNELQLLLPADLETWLLLGYAIVVLAGARVTEALAQMHFRRARSSSEHGFLYDEDADHYHCPQGERLSLHVINPQERLAVYRAPASRCARCPSKKNCTPHDEGRHIFRPLSDFAETDVGRFHQWLSLLMAGSATAISLVGIVRWEGKPGIVPLMLVCLMSVTVTCHDVSRVRAWREGGEEACRADDQS